MKALLTRQCAAALCAAALLLAGCQQRGGPDPDASQSSSVSQAADAPSRGKPAGDATTAPESRDEANQAAGTLTLADAIILPDGAEAGTFHETTYGLNYYGMVDAGEMSLNQFEHDVDYSYNFDQKYLIAMVGKAMDKCAVTEAEKLPADFPLPSGTTGIMFNVFTDTVGGSAHMALVCKSGDIYLTSRGYWDYTLHYRLQDAGCYDNLIEAMQEVIKEGEKLEYLVELSSQLSRFSPASKALRLVLSNESSQAVTIPDGFVLEKWNTSKNEAGPALISKSGEGKQSVTIPPPDDGYWGHAWVFLDLTAYEGGQEPGDYRVRATAQRGDERCELSMVYTIDPASQEISYPPPPEMTPENQDYQERYMRVWGGLGDVMHDNFSEGSMASVLGGNLYLVFHNLDFLDGGTYRDTEEIPANVLEGLMTRRFPITAEQVRGMVSSGSEGTEGDYYDAARGVYVLHSGYGGGPGSIPTVTSSQKNGDLLTLVCDWYSGIDDSYVDQTRVTLRIKDDGDFMYIKNEVLS